jgi:kynurenine formamidase
MDRQRPASWFSSISMLSILVHDVEHPGIQRADGRHVERNDIAILRTGWSDKHWDTNTFWQKGPYLSPDAGDWLIERGVEASMIVPRSTSFAIPDSVAKIA